MSLGIRYKLFLTLLTTILFVVTGMTVFVQWSFDRGFLGYINTRDLEQLQPLVQALETEYAEAGNWQRITGSPHYWHEFLRSELDSIFGRPIRGEKYKRHDGENGDRKKHKDKKYTSREGLVPKSGGIHRRICLLDADKNLLAIGDRNPTTPKETQLLAEITHEGETVGYLGLRSRDELSDTSDLLFLEGQAELLLIIAAGVLVLAVVISLPLAQSLVSPIRKLHAATQRLSSGEYGDDIQIRRNDEIGALAKDFNALSHRLAETHIARKQWVADIAHELRTPLAILQGEVEAIIDGVREANDANIVSLHNELLRMSALVNDLYQLSMADIGALNLDRNSVNLVTCLDEAVDLVEDRLGAAGLELQRGYSSARKVMIKADAGRLHQLFTNLLENSLKYTDAPGVVRVEISESHKEVQIVVADSAPDVDPELRAKLFERLYRVESSRNRTAGGAGLGLSICASIVEAHDGSIAASEATLGGLAVNVKLPK
ncbi:MAG: ATP-binding protein [Pseudomonadota bacterium]